MNKYIDFYGYGVKDKNFNNGWGDNKVLILRKSGVYGLGKSNTLSGSTQYVRFLSAKDAQNFIDNYIPTDTNLSGHEYTPYKVKFNRPAELYDKEYKAYVTTYALPKNTQVAQYDKEGKLLNKTIRIDNLTADDMLMLIDRLGSDFDFAGPPAMYRHRFDQDYAEWLGLPNVFDRAPLPGPTKFKRDDYYVADNAEGIVLSGKVTWGVNFRHILSYALPDWTPDFNEYLYDNHPDIAAAIRGIAFFNGQCTFQISLSGFKEYVKKISAHNFADALSSYIKYVLYTLPLNESPYEDTQQFFKLIKQDVSIKYNTIKEYCDEYNQTDILEDLY